MVTVARNARGKHDMRPVKQVRRFIQHSRCKQGSSCMHNTQGTAAVVGSRHKGSICSLDRESKGVSICGVDQYKGMWERVPITVDSGAIDSVMPKRVATSVMIKQTEASKQGLRYRAANGTSIRNEGERDLKGYTSEGNLVDMSMQVCEVTKPLGSVRAMLQAGNRVVFDKGGSYIQNHATGIKTCIEDKNGAFVFDIWVPRDSGQQGSVQQQSGYNGRYWQALADGEEEGNHETGFVGPDDLFR